MTHMFEMSRKLVAGAAALALAFGLSGCVVTPGDDPVGEPKQIVFSPSVSDSETRAASGHPINNGGTIPLGNSFGVYGFSKIKPTGSVENYTALADMEVTRATGGYTYSPVANWPRESGATLGFMGYYPWLDQSDPQQGDPDITVAPAIGSDGKYSLNMAYTLSGDPADHIDLMYARTGLVTGYDAVTLNFNHALTRLKFTGRKVNYQGTINIVSIAVKGSSTKGELAVYDPVTQPGKPVWSLDGTSKADIVIDGGNGLLAQALTGTLASVMEDGADMLVIPQSVANVKIHVTVSRDGVEQTIVYPLATSVDWVMNEIITYEITVDAEGMNVTTKVDEWENAGVGVICDGPYYMKLNYNRLDFYKEGGNAELEIRTNYDAADGIAAAGSSLNLAGIGSWANITDLGQTLSGGEYVRTVRIAPSSTTVAKTPTSFVVKSRNMEYVFHLTQSGDSWLTATNLKHMYDGELKSVAVESAVDWTVAIKAGTNNPQGGKYPITNLLTESGSAGTGAAYFAPFDNIALSEDPTVGSFVADGTVTLVFSDPRGIYPDKEVAVNLFTPIATYFAKSNIVLYIDGDGNRILTFAERTADFMSKTVNYNNKADKAARSFTLDGTSAPALTANVQGLHFRWGGLVGLSSNADASNMTSYNGAKDIQFWPAEYEDAYYAANGVYPSAVTWKYNGTAREWQDATQVPYLGDQTITTTTKTYDAFEDYFDADYFSAKGESTTVGYDAKAGYGDICRYMSAKGWVKGNWRMPIREELELLYNETRAVGQIDNGHGNMQYGVMYGTYSSGTTWNDLAMTNPDAIYTDYYGFTPVANARMIGGGITAADRENPDYLTRGGKARVVLPAAGRRYSSNGYHFTPGGFGYYWASSPGSATYGSYLYVHGSEATHGMGYDRSNGFSVRCIRN